MKFYNKYFENNYEELITYYPRYYREIFEMVEILKAHSRIADVLEENMERIFLNNFILTADTKTIKIWEEDILDITYRQKLSLDQRKGVVIGMLCGHGHIGEPEIRDIISNYTKNAVSVDFEKGNILILIEGIVFDEVNLYYTLQHRIPAHIGLDMSTHIRRIFKQKLTINYGGAVGTEQHCLLVNKNKMKRNKMHLKGAGGVYCHTHIKSKLIE